MFDRHAKLALIILCLTLAGGGLAFRAAVGALNAYLSKLPVPLRHPLNDVSRTLGRWQAVGTDRVAQQAELDELGTTEFFTRNYAVDGDVEKAAIWVHAAFYTGMIDAVPHVPERCDDVHGWQPVDAPRNYDLDVDRSTWSIDEQHTHRGAGAPYPVVEHRHPVTGRAMTIRMPVGDIQFRVTEFRWPNDPSRRKFAGYLFVANGETTPMPEAVRLKAFDLSSRHAYFCKIQLSMQAGRETSLEDFLALAGELMESLLPEVMRCLPDWSEVEAGGAQDTTTTTNMTGGALPRLGWTDTAPRAAQPSEG
jgi:hypothetical protein